MFNKSADILNNLVFSHEEMIESYARMIRDTEDDELIKILRTIQESHFSRMMALSDRIIELGGDPKFDTGFTGAMDDMRHNHDRKKDLTALETARICLDNEKYFAEKLSVFENDEMDSTSLELVQKAVNMQQENIRQIEEYIRKKEALQQ